MPLDQKLADWRTREARKRTPGKYRLARLLDRHVKADSDAGNLAQYLRDSLELDEDDEDDEDDA